MWSIVLTQELMHNFGMFGQVFNYFTLQSIEEHPPVQYTDCGHFFRTISKLSIIKMAPNSISDTDPKEHELITKDFLLNALKQEREQGWDSEIVSHTTTLGTKPGDNYMSVIYSVDLELQNTVIEGANKGEVVNKTRHLLIKCYPSHPQRQEFTNKSNMFFKEMEVYSKWMPELRRFQKEAIGLDEGQTLKLPYAPYVHGQCIDFDSPEGQLKKTTVLSSLDNFIIMEDIRKTWGFRMTNRRDSLDLDHMKLVITALAKVHSLSWAYRNHVEKDILGKFSCFKSNLAEEDKSMWVQMLYGNIDMAIGIFDEKFGKDNQLSEAAIRYKTLINQVMDFFAGDLEGEGLEELLRVKPDPKKFGKDAENPEPWRIICHGDCWSNNMLFSYDPDTGKPVEITLVDLQIAQETCVTNDLQYVVYTCTSGALRKNHLDELLVLYHDTFNNCCKVLKTETLPGFSIESIKFRFHRSKFLGFFMAMIGLPIMLQDAAKAVNLEEMDDTKDLADMFTEAIGDNSTNDIFKRRLIDVTQDMCDDGVF